MNVVKENLENQVALLKVTVEAADYSQEVENQLKAYKKKAQMPGFRPGMVPMSLINKMYRKGAVAEEAYKVASKAVYEYIQENSISIIGDPIPSDKQVELDFENNTSFEFAFEMGLAPEINIDLSKVTLKKYEIAIDDVLTANFKTSYLQKYGKLVDKEEVLLDEALSVTLEGADTEGEAITIEDAYVGLISMTDEERAPFIGKKIGDKMDVNINDLYKSASQRASILSVKEEELETIKPEFSLTVTRIRKFETPEITEEFLKEAFEDGSVATIEQFEEFVKSSIASNLEEESAAKMVMDGKKSIVEAAALTLPDAFLKKWLLAINEGKFTEEEIEKEYASFNEYVCWSNICGFYSKEGDFAVTPEDVKEEATKLARMQFAYYGMPNPEEAMLENYVKSIIENRDENRRLYETLLGKKCVEYVATKANIQLEQISYDDFAALAEQLGK